MSSSGEHTIRCSPSDDRLGHLYRHLVDVDTLGSIARGKVAATPDQA